MGREKLAYSPPGFAAVGETDGEWGVHGRGIPRRRNEASREVGPTCVHEAKWLITVFTNMVFI